MFLRLVQVGGEGSPPPTIRLSAADGAPVAVPTAPTTAPVFTGTGAHAGDTTLQREAGGVYRIRVFVDQAGSGWQMQIVNNDVAASHGYTWVVSDTDGDTRQPWIDFPLAVAFDAAPGTSATRNVAVRNFGTGPLTMADTSGTALGHGFLLLTVPGPIDPNGVGVVEVRLAAADALTTPGAVYVATSNDTTAKTSAGHNHRVVLVVPRVAVFALDPTHVGAFVTAVAEGRFPDAVESAFAAPHPLGNITFKHESAEPVVASALDDVRARFVAAFPTPAKTLVTYFSVRGDPTAGSEALRKQRCDVIRVATWTTTHTGGAGSIAAGPFEVGQDAFDVARENGVTQSALAFVDVLFDSVEVTILRVGPEHASTYRAARSAGNFVEAMRAAFGAPTILGRFLFDGESKDTIPTTAIETLRERALAEFPNAVTFPDHYSKVGDMRAGSPVARDLRLGAIGRATTTAAGGGGSAPGAGVFEVPQPAMDVARDHGVDGPVVVVVDPLFP